MSIIDATWVTNRCRSFLGQTVTGPIDFNDADILACIDAETLPTFSIYLPYMVDLKIDTVADRIDQREGVYQIRPQGERILGVNRVREGVGAFGAFPYDPLMFGDVLDRQLVADRQSASELSLTFDYRPPNIIEIFPKGLQYSDLYVECKCVHATHFRTIHPGAREIFRELMLADIAIDILSVRQYFQTVQTIFGELNLNLERLNAQADKRPEIIERMESKQLKSSTARRLWIA
jgi:hypothetical protein